MLPMDKIALLFACLVCASHGRRIQSPNSAPAEGRKAVSSGGSFGRGTLESLEVLAAFFLACNGEAAFNPSSPALFRGVNHMSKNRAPRPLASAEDDFDIVFEKGASKELAEAASFSTDHYWGASTTFELDGPMSERNRKVVFELDKEDFEGRYGQLTGPKRFQAQLITARDKQTGEIVGVVGVEIAVLDIMGGYGKVFERKEADRMVKDELNTLSIKENAALRQLSFTEQMGKLFPEYTVSALLSNLVVAPSARGKGLGRLLAEKCEEKARDWGMSGIVLQVEEENYGGRPLYQKLGYQDIHINPEGQAQRIQRGAATRMDALKFVPSTICLMGKAV